MPDTAAFAANATVSASKLQCQFIIGIEQDSDPHLLRSVTDVNAVSC